MKQILTGHDVRILTGELQNLIGARLNQVYDINTRSLCLKLDNNREKVYLILDSGNKFYTVKEFSSLRPAPTSFCSKLRKHLNNKRIESIEQIRGDRVLSIQFGTDDFSFRILLELYASGNIVLVDKDYKILNLLHAFHYDDDNKVKVGNVYPIEAATQDINNAVVTVEDMKNWFLNNPVDKKTKLKNIFNRSPLTVYGPVLIDHALTLLGYDIKSKIDRDFAFTDKEISMIIDTTKSEFFKNSPKQGYIVLNDDGDFESVIPINYEHMKDRIKSVYSSFEEACSVYFRKIDENRFDAKTYKSDKSDRSNKSNKSNKKDVEEKKINNIQNQIDSLIEKKEKIYTVAKAVNEDIDNIDKLLRAVNKAHYNRDLDLVQQITEMYGYTLSSIDPQNKKIVINKDEIEMELDYTLSAYKNVSGNFQIGKKYKNKADKATDIKNSVVKKDKKISDSKKLDYLDLPERKKSQWFEEFNWFITSDGFLVVSGKTADQNETIVKRYMNKDDIYVHSNMPGSGSCVIKNDDKKEIPITTLEQAGHFVVCKTKAWNEGAGDRAWWVYPDQVSKTTESGEYVTKGSFIIRGKKNYISHCSLVMSLSIMFKNSDSGELSPLCTDKVEYAVPMCAPYSATKNHKFRVKLTPGKQKIGKVLKEIISSFIKKGDIYERTAIRNIPIDDYHRVLISGIRVVF